VRDAGPTVAGHPDVAFIPSAVQLATSAMLLEEGVERGQHLRHGAGCYHEHNGVRGSHRSTNTRAASREATARAGVPPTRSRGSAPPKDALARSSTRALAVLTELRLGG
jgi:hypothetical protein